MNRPQLVVHADWSVNPQKRMMACATLGAHGRYQIAQPQPVGNLTTWLARLGAVAQGSTCLIGVDFPIGLPKAYADRAGIGNFMAWLPKSGDAAWASFYDVAETVEQIGTKRPFYPKRSGGTQQQQLVKGLGVEDINALRRACDLAGNGRRAAASLFWTMGAQQVGKAAISGWRDCLVPNMALLHIWPFSGRLSALLAQSEKPFIVAEVYPAEMYRWLGVSFGAGGKQNAAARCQNAAILQNAAKAMEVKINAETEAALTRGFDSDDAFDAFVGVLGMLWVLLGVRPLFEPTRPYVRQIEGWILGQQE